MMRFFRFFLLMAALSAGCMSALAASDAADAPHVHVQLLVPGQVLGSNKPNDGALYFRLEPGWHIYWMNAGDAGEPPHVRWELPQGLSATALRFATPKRLPLGPLMDYGYEGEAFFPFKILVGKAVPAGQATLRANVDWLVCRGSCIPGKATLEVSRPVGAVVKSASFPEEVKKIRFPQPLPLDAKAGFTATAQGFRLTVETGKRESEATFFPADQDQIDNPAPQKLTPTANGFSLDLKKDSQLTSAPRQLRGVIELSGGRAYEIMARSGALAVSSPAQSGGDAAKTPVESAPVPSVAGQTGDSTGGSAAAQTSGSATPAPMALWRAVGLAFLGGLVLNLMPCVFPVLFLKGLSLAQSGNEERGRLRLHGLVYTAGILVSFWILVSVFLGLRAAGGTLGWGFQFQSPVFLSLMAGLLFFLGLSLAGQFEVGLTLTSAGGSLAQKQGFAGSFFTGVLAVIVATPCTAPMMGAAVGYALSQTALTAFLVFTALALGLASPYVALTMQPAWTRLLPRPGVWMEILKQATSVPIFATVIWLSWVLARSYGAEVLSALLAGFLLLAIAGWFLGRWPGKRGASLVAGVFVLAMVSLVVYGQRFAEDRQNAASSTAGADSGVWSADAVAKAQAEGRPVFVDFTASWCLSCQVNERVALRNPQVEAAFHEKKILLLKADWTRHDEAITKALNSLGRSGVPTYVYYAPESKSPRLLPEALTPGIVLDAIK